MATRCYTWLSGVGTFSTECAQPMEPMVGTPGCPVCVTPLPGAGLVPCDACPQVSGSPPSERAKFRYRLSIGSVVKPNTDPLWVWNTNLPNSYTANSWDLVHHGDVECLWVSAEKELVVYFDDNNDSQKSTTVYLTPVDAFSQTCLDGTFPIDTPIVARPRFELEMQWDSSKSKVRWVLSVNWRSVVSHPLCGSFGRPSTEYILRFTAYSNDCLTVPSSWQPSTGGPTAAFYSTGTPLMRSPWFWLLPSTNFVNNFYVYLTLTAV